MYGSKPEQIRINQRIDSTRDMSRYFPKKGKQMANQEISRNDQLPKQQSSIAFTVSQITSSIYSSGVEYLSSNVQKGGSQNQRPATKNVEPNRSSLQDLISLKNKMERQTSNSNKNKKVLTEDQYLKRKSTINSKSSKIQLTDSQLSPHASSKISSGVSKQISSGEFKTFKKVQGRRTVLEDSCSVKPTKSFAVTTQNHLPQMKSMSPSPNRTTSYNGSSNSSPSISPRVPFNAAKSARSRGKVSQNRQRFMKQYSNSSNSKIVYGSNYNSQSALSSRIKSPLSNRDSYEGENEGGQMSGNLTDRTKSRKTDNLSKNHIQPYQKDGQQKISKPTVNTRVQPNDKFKSPKQNNFIPGKQKSKMEFGSPDNGVRRDSISPDGSKGQFRSPSNESGQTRTTKAATNQGKLSNIRSNDSSNQVGNQYSGVNRTQRVEQSASPLRKNLETKPRRRQRYNPYKDPNFDPEAAEYQNEEFKSHSEVYEITNAPLQDQSVSQDSNVFKQRSARSQNENSRSSKASNESDKVLIPQCKMKRQRFVHEQVTQSQIGGGKAFRESQVKNIQYERQKNQLKSFASRIKANSLSDIESINSEEESDHNESTANNKDNEVSPDPKKSHVPAQCIATESDSSDENFQIHAVPSQEQKQEINIQKVKEIPFIAQKIYKKKLKPVSYHAQKYSDYCKRVDEWNSKLTNDMLQDEMKAVKKYLQNNKLFCVKFNHSLDPEGQVHSSYQSYIQLSSDSQDGGQTLKIVNLKSKQEVQYLLSTDPNEIDRVRKQIQFDKAKEKVMNKMGATIKEGMVSLGSFQGNKSTDCKSIYMQKFKKPDNVDESKYNIDKSDGTCKIQDIEGLVYGGMSSRFWVQRKHINFESSGSLKNIPFLSWNCLTLQLAHRDVDLVIENEMEMEIFLKFLIYNLKTVDGTKNTSLRYIEGLNRQSYSEYKKQFNREVITKAREHQIIQKNEFTLYRKVFLKYQIMKIRAKISFMALQKCMTVAELIVDAIKRTYFEQAALGDQPICFKQLAHHENIFKALQRGEKGILRLVIRMNAQLDCKLLEPARKQEILNKMVKVKALKETIEVKKHGIIKSVKIDEGKNKAKEDEIQQILKKNECMDIFKDLVYDKEQQVYDQNSYQDYIQFKFKKKSRIILYNKIKMMMDMKLINGILYIDAIRKRIEISKELLILELEQGNEALIYQELSQDNLPYSFRYYDSILRLINDKIQAENRDFYRIKEQLAVQLHKQQASTQNFINQIASSGGKQVYKHHAVDQKDKHDIDIHKSMHSMDIQRSRYIQIDSEFDPRALEQNNDKDELVTQFLSYTGYPDKLLATDNCMTKINIKYLHPVEVNQKRMKILRMKQKFLAKQGHLKDLGLMITLKQKIAKWISEEFESKNLDEKKKLSLLAFLHSETERIVKKRMMARRQYQINKLKENCKKSNQFEKIVKFVETGIEKDYQYFNNFGDSDKDAAKEMRLIQKIVKINKKKRTQKEKNMLISQAINRSKIQSKVSLNRNSLNISKRSNEMKKNKQQIIKHQDMSQTDIMNLSAKLSQKQASEFFKNEEDDIKVKLQGDSEKEETSQSVSKSNQQSNYWMAKNILDEISESEEQSSSSQEMQFKRK